MGRLCLALLFYQPAAFSLEKLKLLNWSAFGLPGLKLTVMPDYKISDATGIYLVCLAPLKHTSGALLNYPCVYDIDQRVNRQCS